MIYAATATDQHLVPQMKIVIGKNHLFLKKKKKKSYFHEFIMTQVNIIVEGECA